MKKYDLKLNELGYMEVYPKPSLEELEEHYRDKYFQLTTSSSYKSSYSDEELLFMDLEAEMCIATINKYTFVSNTLLDVGCGEGYFSKYFLDKGWKLKCVDFSINGIKNHNPSLIPYFQQGDLLEWLQNNNSNDSKYGLINLDNVLEHVIDPKELLLSLKPLLCSDTLLRIEVPNDFSGFQKYLIQQGFTKENWISPPEHLSYFNRSSLINLLDSVGYKVISVQADFPIEQFLINKYSNYNGDKGRGKEAHTSRVLITNFLAKQNLDRYIDYREASADLDYGRLLTAYVKLK